MTRRKGKKPMGRQALAVRENPPQEEILAVASTSFRVDPCSDNTLLETGKRLLTNTVEAAVVLKIGDMRVVCNPDGGRLMRDMEELKASVAAITEKVHHLEDRNLSLEAAVASLKDRNSSLEAAVASLLPFRRLFIDIRERAFLTYLRDFWEDYGSSSRSKRRRLSGQAAEVQAKIISLNRSIVHGGMAEADAIMFLEKKPIEVLTPFVSLYGLEPHVITELASREYKATMNVLNAAGSVHYESHHMRDDQQQVFNTVVELARNGNFDSAEEVASDFPFDADFTPVISLTPVHEEVAE